MEWRKGDMLDIAQRGGCNVIAFTANAVTLATSAQREFSSTSDIDFALVMGVGAAKRVRDTFPGVNVRLGNKINQTGKSGVQPDYFGKTTKLNDGRVVLALQVKRHYKDDGDWTLTERSLRALAKYMTIKKERAAVLNCPLIGAGGYRDRESEVKALVEDCLAGCDILVCTL